MKNLLSLLLIISFSISCSFASHIPGGNITYQCTGNPNEYVVTLELYVNCPNTLGTLYSITAANSCGLSNPTISLPQIGIAQEISSICPSQQSTCAGGTLPGIMSYTYQSIITLPDTCNSWTFTFELCCRNQSSNLAGGQGNSMYFETVMNSQTAPCDNSPYATTQPSPFVCAGLPQTFCPGVIDPDGDSLYYQLVNPYGAGGVPIIHNVPYTPTAPLLNLVLDANTGCISFNEPTIGNYVVTYLIEAYDNAGNMTGSVVYDFQFQVLTCSNTSPTADPGGIVITGGTGYLLSPNLIEVCEGNTTCFDVIFNDADATDILAIDTALSNLFTQLPGAILNLTGTNPLTINVCWTVPAGTNNSASTSISVNDGACPVMGIANQPISFSIILSTVANSDITICGSENAQLNASGGSVFTWSTLSGDPINVGTNFSCNPCANPVASPTVNSTYLVTSNLAGGCSNTDTVSVLIVPDYSIATTQNIANICLGGSVNFTATPTPSGLYNYLWSPAANMNNSAIANPTGTFNTPGVNIVIVEVNQAGACIKKDTLFVSTSTIPQPNITVSPNPAGLCDSSSIQLDINLGGGIPTSCGPSPTTTCSTAPTTTIVGVQTGVNDSTVYPAPYGNWYKNAKHQFLYTAAELNAMGITGGKITEISWEVTQVVGTSVYYDYQLSMGCTPSNSLTVWETGLTQVLNPDTVNIAVGMNTHLLDVAYEWDGVSNLVLEICFNNLAEPTYTKNSLTPWATTTFNSCLYYFSDALVACIQPTATPSTNRPVTHFTWCPTNLDPNMYNYVWSPSLGLSNANIINPVASPSVTTTYYVTVTDTSGLCFDTDTVNVNVVPGFTLQTTQDDSICVGDTVNFIVSPSLAGTYSYLWTPGILMDDSTIFNPSGIFNAIGTNVITVEVDNSLGCSIIDTVIITVDSCTTVNVNELGKTYDIKIYPNPNNGNFTIEKPFGLDKSMNIKIYNVLGKLIKELSLNTNESSKIINISDESKGIYLIHLKTGDEHIVRKILKN